MQAYVSNSASNTDSVREYNVQYGWLIRHMHNKVWLGYNTTAVKCTHLLHDCWIVALVLIEIPAQVWRPKVNSRYIMLTFRNNIEDSIFNYTCYRNFLFKPASTQVTNVTRDGCILFAEPLGSAKLEHGVKIDNAVNTITCSRVVAIIK